MVAGAAIDEQRQQRQLFHDPAAGQAAAPLPGAPPDINEEAPGDEDSDEERDPNVAVVQAQNANKPVHALEPVDILDVSDYGDSSDDSD